MFNISIKGYNWSKKDCNKMYLNFIMQTYNLDPISAEILCNRIDNIENYRSFINPSLKEDLPNPMLLLDMEKSATRVAQAIINNQKIAIFGDYDVDGATSSSLIARFFMMIGFYEYIVYIPDRIKEGYGPSLYSFEKLKEQGVNVIITVDCGTLSFEPIEYANQHNIDVIVIDHHISDFKLPNAYGIINPNRFDEKFPHNNLAAVGVSFLFVIALNSILRSMNFYKNSKEPNLILLMDLVCIGTICDVMTIKGLNRLFVKIGLDVIKKGYNKGVKSLIDVCNIKEEVNVYHIGFRLGPRINAGGRVGKCDLGSILLRSVDYDSAIIYAKELDNFNNNRKSIEDLVLTEAFSISEKEAFNSKILVISGEGWHPGVIGIVCSRIKEKYNLPTVIISFDGDIGKASLRSVAGLDIGKAVVQAKNNGLLVAGGGHEMAAGFTIQKDKLYLMKEYLQEFASKNMFSNAVTNKFYDVEVPSVSPNEMIYKSLQIAAPYGNGNEEPIIKINNLCITHMQEFKNNMFRLSVISAIDSNQKFSATIFNTSGHFDVSKLKLGKKLDLIGKLLPNNWNGRTYYNIIVEDIIYIN
jgi:single-stranded-DNA-specific exonuclease